MNLGSYYFVGVPLGLLLGFHFHLGGRVNSINQLKFSLLFDQTISRSTIYYKNVNIKRGFGWESYVHSSSKVHLFPSSPFSQIGKKRYKKLY